MCPGDICEIPWILGDNYPLGEYRVNGSFGYKDRICQGYAYFNITETPAFTQLIINPQKVITKKEQVFSIDIIIDPTELISGAQTDLSFDPSFITVDLVEDGGMFDMWVESQLQIDNENGIIKNIVAFDQGSVTTPGIFATITFSATAQQGTSSLDITNAIVGRPNGSPVPITTINSTVIIPHEPWDTNNDNAVNTLDLIIIGQHWGETGPPCWIPADVNYDGVINILDLIVVGQHWTG
jgi:hypothetical protein